MVLFPHIDLIPSVLNSAFESAVYEVVFLSSISGQRVNSKLILPRMDAAFFEGYSVDYDPKSRR